MANERTIGGLYKAKEVSDDDLDAVATGWLEDRIEGPSPIGQHAVDVAAAVEAHKPAKDALADEKATEAFQRTMVRTAIVLASVAKA